MGLPDWWMKLIKQHRQGVGRVFILHGNINDLVFYPCGQDEEDGIYRWKPHPLREMLPYLLAVQGGFGPIFGYSPTQALYQFYIDKDQLPQKVNVDEKRLADALQNLPAEAEGPMAQIWESFAEQVRTSTRKPQPLDQILPQMEEYLEKLKPKYFRMALILDFFEKITTFTTDHSNYLAEEIIRRWALADLVKKSQNLVLGLTNALDELPRLLSQTDSQIQLIHLPLPDPNDRKHFLDYWAEPISYDQEVGELAIAPLDGSDTVAASPAGKSSSDLQPAADQERQREILAGLSKGFSLLDLEALVKMAKVEGPGGMVGMELFQSYKKALISEESNKLLVEITDKRGFDQVGGLKYAKDFLKKVASDITVAAYDPARGRSIPKGILLAGPPGTGKTILAEALAAEAGMTLVRMGDVMGGVVGQSEKNMSNVLNLLKNLAPVAVFVDEIDQAIGRRVTGYEGDSGVTRRLFAKLLEFMGDNDNRGKVLWIGASNQPELLDEAHLSRFDAVMAILPPYSMEERIKILEVMEGNIEGVTYSPDLEANLAEVADKVAGLSGRDIETIVRNAADRTESGDLSLEVIKAAIHHYKPNANQHKIDGWTVQTLMKVNFTDMMPRDEEAYPPRIWKFVRKIFDGTDKSNAPLERCLEMIQRREGDWAT